MILLYKIENTYLVRGALDTDASKQHYKALERFFASYGKITTKCFEEDDGLVSYIEFIQMQPTMSRLDVSDKNDVQNANEWFAVSFCEIIEDEAQRRGYGWRVDPNNYSIVNSETNEVVPAKETLAELFEGTGFKIDTMLPDTHRTISAVYYTRPEEVRSLLKTHPLTRPSPSLLFTENHTYFRNLLLCHIVLKNGNVVTGESSISATDPNMVEVAKDMAFNDAFGKLMR